MKMITRSVLLAAVGSAVVLIAPPALADSGSAAFYQYVQGLGQRLHQINDNDYWVSTVVDKDAFGRYLAATGAAASSSGSMNRFPDRSVWCP